MKRLLLIVLGGLTLSFLAQAASFDCGKATTKVEKLICADAAISKLDEELAAVYKIALHDEKQANTFRQTQKQWLKERNGCTDAACVKQTYEKRQVTLQSVVIASASQRVVATKPTTGVNKLQAHYVLMMSEDDSVCKPILAEYNRDISLDLWPKSAPYPYPWPAPSELALTWKIQPWKALAEDERVLEKTYTLTEADLDGSGKKKTVVRWATWVRGDDRFSSLEIFSHGAVLPDQINAYQQYVRQNAIAEVIPGGYDFPKLKGRTTPADLNDFDVIQHNGKHYVTSKSVDMDGIVEMHNGPQWRVISRVRFSKPATPPESDLDWILDSVCYFKLKITR